MDSKMGKIVRFTKKHLSNKTNQGIDELGEQFKKKSIDSYIQSVKSVFSYIIDKLKDREYLLFKVEFSSYEEKKQAINIIQSYPKWLHIDSSYMVYTTTDKKWIIFYDNQEKGKDILQKWKRIPFKKHNMKLVGSNPENKTGSRVVTQSEVSGIVDDMPISLSGNQYPNDIMEFHDSSKQNEARKILKLYPQWEKLPETLRLLYSPSENRIYFSHEGKVKSVAFRKHSFRITS